MSHELMNTLPEIDKLTENFSLRIPEITKYKIDKLPATYKRKLNESILLTIAHILHDAEFDPKIYLKSE